MACEGSRGKSITPAKDSQGRKCCDCKRVKQLKLLPCFHCCCVRCIEKWQGQGQPQKQVNCSTCGSDVMLPGGDPQKLPDASTTTNLEEPALICQLCDEDQVTHVCTLCTVFICTRCFRSHGRVEATKHHKPMPIQDWNDVSDKSALMRPFGHCTEHKDEALKFYCNQCQKPVCNTCCILKCLRSSGTSNPAKGRNSMRYSNYGGNEQQNAQSHTVVELTEVVEENITSLKSNMESSYNSVAGKEENAERILQGLQQFKISANQKKLEIIKATNDTISYLGKELAASIAQLQANFAREEREWLEKKGELLSTVESQVEDAQRRGFQATSTLRVQQEDEWMNVLEMESVYRDGSAAELVRYQQTSRSGKSSHHRQSDQLVKFPAFPNLPSLQQKRQQEERSKKHSKQQDPFAQKYR